MESRGEGLVFSRHLLVWFLLGQGCLGAIRRLGCGTPVSDLSRLLEWHEPKAKALALTEEGSTLLWWKREHEGLCLCREILEEVEGVDDEGSLLVGGLREIPDDQLACGAGPVVLDDDGEHVPAEL